MGYSIYVIEEDAKKRELIYELLDSLEVPMLPKEKDFFEPFKTPEGGCYVADEHKETAVGINYGPIHTIARRLIFVAIREIAKRFKDRIIYDGQEEMKPEDLEMTEEKRKILSLSFGMDGLFMKKKTDKILDEIEEEVRNKIVKCRKCGQDRPFVDIFFKNNICDLISMDSMKCPECGRLPADNPAVKQQMEWKKNKEKK